MPSLLEQRNNVQYEIEQLEEKLREANSKLFELDERIEAQQRRLHKARKAMKAQISPARPAFEKTDQPMQGPKQEVEK